MCDQNFGYVEDSLYRSGEPAELNFPFLERLHLRALVWLAPHAPSERLSVPSPFFIDIRQALTCDQSVVPALPQRLVL